MNTSKLGKRAVTDAVLYGDRFLLKVDSIVLMLKSRYFDASERIKTGFSDGGAWGRIYPALCLRDGITQDSDCSVPMTDD